LTSATAVSRPGSACGVRRRTAWRRLDLAHHQAAQAGRAAQDVVELFLLVAQLLELLLDLDRLQPRQLAQADLEDVFGLALADSAKRAISAALGSSLRG
jgi:hypothetical protein